MKDLKLEHKASFQVDSSEALARIQVALDFLWKDDVRSIDDKVAGDFDYEELIGALLCAEAALKEIAEDFSGDA